MMYAKFQDIRTIDSTRVDSEVGGEPIDYTDYDYSLQWSNLFDPGLKLEWTYLVLELDPHSPHENIFWDAKVLFITIKYFFYDNFFFSFL